MRHPRAKQDAPIPIVRQRFGDLRSIPDRLRPIRTGPRELLANSLAPSQGVTAETAEVAVVGGGIIGTSIAFHLAKRGLTDVILLERSHIASGSTGRSVGIVETIYPTEVNVPLAKFGLQELSRFDSITGRTADFHSQRYLETVRDSKHRALLESEAEIGRRHGFRLRLLEPDDLADIFPELRSTDVAAGPPLRGRRIRQQENSSLEFDVCTTTLFSGSPVPGCRRIHQRIRGGRGLNRRIVSVCLVSLISLLAVTVALTPAARAMPKAGKFTFHAGDGFHAVGVSLTMPDNATNFDTGDFVLLTGTGTFNTTNKSVLGSGTFKQFMINATCVALPFNSGTWMATGFVGFDSYGMSGSPSQSGYFGGRLVIRVLLTPHGDSAILTITSTLGSPPAGARQGVKLNIQDNETFSKSAGGNTTFIFMGP